MKKVSLFACLLLVFLVVGCGWKANKKVDITETSFNVASCDKYFKLLDCILENDDTIDYDDEDREELREYIKSMQEEWSGLSNNSLDGRCVTELNKFYDRVDQLTEIWCSLD